MRSAAEDTRRNEVEAVRKAIAVRMDSLDEAFLMTLGGFVRASAEDGDAAMHGKDLVFELKSFSPQVAWPAELGSFACRGS